MSRHALAIAAAVLLLEGCSSRTGIPFGDPVEIRTAQQEQGRILYMRNCNQCHPDGGPGVAPGIVQYRLPAAAVAAQIRLGAGAMPSYTEEELSDDDVDAINAYLQLLYAEAD